jgi:type II secretory pathway component PulC
VIVQAGAIPRDSLVKVLDRGIARFLQQVDTRPLVAQGRFVGWKLLAFFPGHELLGDGAVKAGDTVLRVNGRSIERPESFKTVWDSLYTARELRVLLLRQGRVYELRYAIAQGTAPEGASAEPEQAAGRARVPTE